MKPQKAVSAYFQRSAFSWKQIYDRTDLYSILYQKRRDTVLALVDELRPVSGAQILDVGYGPGLMAHALLQRGHFVHAIDTVPAMLDMTRQLSRHSDVGPHAIFSQCDIYNLGFKNNVFDLVLVVGVAEWLECLGDAVSEITRVLRPEGLLILTGENTWSVQRIVDPLLNPMLTPAKRFIRKLGDNFLKGPPVYARSVRQHESALSANGLEIIRRIMFGFGPFSFLGKSLFTNSTAIKLNERLQRWADANWPVIRFGGDVYVAVARKP